MPRSPLIYLLTLVLSAALGAAFYGGARHWIGMAAGDTATADGSVRAYLLENPQVIPEAMQRLQDREMAKAVASNRGAITTPFGSAWTGAAKGDVTVVAFMDYACGYCRASLPAIEQLVASDPGIRIVYRELPILSEQSREAAEWALAAAEQGKFKPFHDALYAGGQLSDQSIANAARAARIDVARASRTRAAPAVEREIGNNLALARQLNLTGTPSWVIGDRVLSGAQTFEALRDAVALARKSG